MTGEEENPEGIPDAAPLLRPGRLPRSRAGIGARVAGDERPRRVRILDDPGPEHAPLSRAPRRRDASPDRADEFSCRGSKRRSSSPAIASSFPRTGIRACSTPRGTASSRSSAPIPFRRGSSRPAARRLEKTLFMVHGENTTVVGYRLLSAGAARLEVRPLIAFRDHHALTRENGALDPGVAVDPGAATVAPYPGLPPLHVAHDGELALTGHWYRSFEYDEERRRGFDFTEDLFQPFVLTFDLAGAARRGATVIASTRRHTSAEIHLLRKNELTRRKELARAVGGEDPSLPPSGPRRRPVPRRARRRVDGHRRLSVVLRLGARRDDLPPGPDARDRTAGDGTEDPPLVRPARERGDGAEPLPRRRTGPPSTTPSMRRSGSSRRSGGSSRPPATPRGSASVSGASFRRSSTGMSRGRASASTSIRMASSSPALRAWR